MVQYDNKGVYVRMGRSDQHIPLQHLEQQERVLWVGRSNPTALAISWLPASFCGLMLTGLIMFTPLRDLLIPENAGFRGGPMLQPLFLSMLPLGTLAVSLALLLMPLMACVLSRLTVYGVTDRRLLLLAIGTASRVVQEARYGTIAAAMLCPRRNSVGDIQLFMRGTLGDCIGKVPLLERMIAVADAQVVHATILEQMRRLEESAGGGAVVHDYLELLAQGKRSTDGGI